MTIKTGMTIEDYIKKATGRYHVVRQDLKPQKETQGASSDFNGILSTFRKPSRQSDPKTTKGLSVADYRLHPAASPYPLSSKITSSESETISASSSKAMSPKEASEYFLGPDTLNMPHLSAAAADEAARTTALSGTGNSSGSQQQGFGKNMSSSQFTVANPAIEKAIRDAAAQYQLSPKLIRGVIKAESNFDAHAVSPAGAQGLMQLMPATAKDLGVKNPFDIRQNIDGGVRYLKKMLDMFDGNVRQALSAYNAGPETVKRYNGNVPYRETRQYVDRVIGQIETAV